MVCARMNSTRRKASRIGTTIELGSRLPDATSCSIGVKRRKFCGSISNTSTSGSRATVRSSSRAA